MPNFVHDSLFKFYMQDIEFAKEFIKTYFSYDETSIMLLDTLKLEPVEMIAKNLRKSFVDILYSVLSICHKYKIYILIEHQSSPDSLMQARLYEYMASILRKHKRNNKAILKLLGKMNKQEVANYFDLTDSEIDEIISKG